MRGYFVEYIYDLKLNKGNCIMKKIKEFEKSVFAKASSSSDPNRLYSILLDTKASAVSENMYDISEKILINEKDNSKYTLEQLWSLKKNLTDEAESSTVDMLISFYQDKMNVVRQKEEHIKKISKDSRDLLEEKRKRDSEIANVKQEISECTSEVERLNSKLHQLSVKEQELQLIGGQLEKELQLNTNEVVNGLYEIILIGQDDEESTFSVENELANDSIDPVENSVSGDDTISIEKQSVVEGSEVLIEELMKKTEQKEEDEKKYLQEPEIETILQTTTFPKSVVKTTKGKIIGEYYYNTKVEKKSRHYIYNSSFFARKLDGLASRLSLAFDDSLFAEAVQLLQDANRRIPTQSTIHFEISTNEILNGKTLSAINQELTRRNYSEVVKYCRKLNAKIENLGSNYFKMLEEQMERYSIDD